MKECHQLRLHLLEDELGLLLLEHHICMQKKRNTCLHVKTHTHLVDRMLILTIHRGTLRLCNLTLVMQSIPGFDLLPLQISQEVIVILLDDVGAVTTTSL
jgi:hypothetical protein